MARPSTHSRGRLRTFGPFFAGHGEDLVILPFAANAKIAKRQSLKPKSERRDNRKAAPIQGHDRRLHSVKANDIKPERQDAVQRFADQALSLMIAIDPVAKVAAEHRAALNLGQGDSANNRAACFFEQVELIAKATTPLSPLTFGAFDHGRERRLTERIPSLEV